VNAAADWDPARFFAAGHAHVAAVMADVARHAPRLGRDAVLDLHCGLGRATRPFAAHFDRAVGVDPSRVALRRARWFHRDEARCRFRHSLRWLRAGSFDLVHGAAMSPSSARQQLPSLIRLLRPGGLLWLELEAPPASTEELGLAPATTPIIATRQTTAGPPGIVLIATKFNQSTTYD
jgi:SAM-dependent methyltransferase